MKLIRFILLIIFILCTGTSLMGQSVAEVQKSKVARISDSIYEAFANEGFFPEKQLLYNTFSEDFPYNVIVRLGTSVQDDGTNKKKLLIVLPQQDSLVFLEDYIRFITGLKDRVFPYIVEFVFTANDKSAIPSGTIKTDYPSYPPEGSSTYIYNLKTTENTAVIIIKAKDTDIFTPLSLPLFEKNIGLIAGGISSSDENLIVSRGFFEMITNSFSDANVPFFVVGQFLSLYRLGMAGDHPIIVTWLDSNIPAVLLEASPSNIENILKTIDLALNLYATADISNQDTHYSLIQVFSMSFFISEQNYLLFLIIATAIILFIFCNLSFIKGAHKYIHRQEFLKTWYLIPCIVLLTGFFLFVSQSFAQILSLDTWGLPFFSLIIKTLLAILLLILFSSFHHAIKLPITGFIYGYLLLVSAFINIFIFAIIEITLIPIFIAEYLIVYFSRTVRRVVPLIVYTLLMMIPYLPFIFALSELDYAVTVEFITDASFPLNLLFGFILLPFQIIFIRILIRLKLWSKQRNITTKKLLLQSTFVFGTIALVCLATFFVPYIIEFTQKSDVISKQSAKALDPLITIESSKSTLIGRQLTTLQISSSQEVLRYYIEISSNNLLPIFDANYPYNILIKPFTAVFILDEYPPEPLVLTFMTETTEDILCSITAWLKTDDGIKKEQVYYPLMVAQE